MPLSPALRIDGVPTTAHLDRDALANHRFADGGGFPPSYRATVEQIGWGRLFGLWLLYPPVLAGYADGWQGRARILTERFRAHYRDSETEEFDWVIEPDGSWQLAQSLTLFAWSENGDALLWDTASRDANGEFPIWESPSLDALHRRGDTLDEALAILRERAPGRTYDVEPLAAIRLDD